MADKELSQKLQVEQDDLSLARRVPIPLQPKVNDVLGHLQTAGLFEAITIATSWCTPMVSVVKKSGKVRICVELKKIHLYRRRQLEAYLVDDVSVGIG